MIRFCRRIVASSKGRTPQSLDEWRVVEPVLRDGAVGGELERFGNTARALRLLHRRLDPVLRPLGPYVAASTGSSVPHGGPRPMPTTNNST